MEDTIIAIETIENSLINGQLSQAARQIDKNFSSFHEFVISYVGYWQTLLHRLYESSSLVLILKCAAISYRNYKQQTGEQA